jgi:hypothetical protein
MQRYLLMPCYPLRFFCDLYPLCGKWAFIDRIINVNYWLH